ncbi:MAG TPA: hypothetical protein VFZ74_08610, partial [Burkholderiales bacterium]
MQQAKGNGDPFLALSTAAAVVYHQIAGQTSESADEIIDVLNSVASAIANVAPIYTADRPSGTP